MCVGAVFLLRVGNDHNLPQIAVPDWTPVTEINLYLAGNPTLIVVPLVSSYFFFPLVIIL